MDQFLSRAERHQLHERLTAGQRKDQGVARRGIERRGPQHGAGPESPTEFRAVELVVSLRDHINITDPRGESLADRIRRELSAAESKQYAAAGERIDERSCVAD